MTDESHNRRAEDANNPGGGIRWQRTISLDSVIVLITTIVGGVYFISSISHRQETNELKIDVATRTMERIEADFKLQNKITQDNLQETNRLLRDVMLEQARLQRKEK